MPFRKNDIEIEDNKCSLPESSTDFWKNGSAGIWSWLGWMHNANVCHHLALMSVQTLTEN